MGAASSFPAVLTEEHAKLVAGDAWEGIKDAWPVDRQVVTRDELEAMIEAHPEVSKIVVKWDEVPVGAAGAAPPAEADGGARKEKVATATRQRFDARQQRADKTQPKRAPPRAKETAEKRASRQQSEQLRQLLRAQRAAARADGRPPSRGMDDVECSLYVKPQDSHMAVEVMTLGDCDAPDVFTCDDGATETPATPPKPETTPPKAAAPARHRTPEPQPQAARLESPPAAAVAVDAADGAEPATDDAAPASEAVVAAAVETHFAAVGPPLADGKIGVEHLDQLFSTTAPPSLVST
ncbi:hypothetical protein M885DRAFT_523907 [Pelagophyceae sp. CCMP2097]|nr:hypothetical protein M885DRAFT_523907 [Pelagophyceae sp. CCMP2097]